MPRRTEFEIDSYVGAQDGSFLFKEPIVLLTIICLSLSNGITLTVQNLWAQDGALRGELFHVWGMSASAVPMIGILFFSFLSEVHGRKPIFITLFALSILSDILYLLPWHGIKYFSLPVQGLVRGGLRAMSTLAITEYCTPKHRFTYMLANSVTFFTIHYLTSILFTLKPTSYLYVQSFQIVLGLVCLATARKWPESPYWLASKEKLEESRKSFLWLRGEEGRKELNSLLKERRSPGPLKLYWISFTVVIATMSVSIFSNIGSLFFQRWVRAHSFPEDSFLDNILRSCISAVIAFLIAFVSYFVERKVLFLLVAGLSMVFSYGIAIWIHVDPTVNEPSNQLFYFVFFTFDEISRYGPAILGIILSVEIVPLKYNTHMACIGLLYSYIVYFPFITFFWRSFVDFELSHAYIPVFTTVSLVGVVVYGCLAPETKDKTLLEIQKMYTPELSKENPEEEHAVMTHI